MFGASVLTGPLEPTNERYARQDRRIKMAEAYRSQYGHDFIGVMPTNLYGPAAFTRRSHRVRRALRSGTPASRGGSFSMSTTWRMPTST
jgi:nucleoside-diphosphate-sugar epimerase